MRSGNLTPRSYAQGLDSMQTVPVGESMTRQDQADSANINVIYAKTQRGEIILAKDVMPTFDDFSHEMTYDRMLEAIQEAEDAFMSLPSSEREKFGHDPAKYYEGVYKEAKSKLDASLAEEKKASDKEKELKAIADAKALLGEDKESS